MNDKKQEQVTNSQDNRSENLIESHLEAKRFSLKNKKSILAGFLIVCAALLLGGAVYAYFNATQTSDTNIFTTGSVAMAVDGKNPWTDTFNASLNNSIPGTTGWGNVTLSNVGQDPMDVWVNISNVVTGDGTDTQPESLEPTANDIDGVCRYGLIIGGSDVLSSSNYTISSGSHQLSGLTSDVKNNYIWLGNIASGGTLNVNQSFGLDSATSNWAQGDIMNFKVTFYAQQSQGTPRPTAPSSELSGHGRP